MLEGIVELNQFEIDDQVTKTNKLKGITEMIINLDELNNSVNLKDGRPSYELLTYHVPLHQELGNSLEFLGKRWAKVGNFSQEFAGIPRISCK